MANITLGVILKNFIFHGQTFLVYPAAFIKSRRLRNPGYYNLPYRDVEITTSDNIRLRCYLIEWTSSSAASPPVSASSPLSSTARPSSPSPSSGNPRATVIMFHGNGMDHSDLLSRARKYYHYGCNVLTVSYRGYALSKGVPSESGLQKDAQAALDFVWNDDDLGKLPIIVYGLSLGGAVAIDVTSKNPEKVASLILENTFTSIPQIVRDWPYIGRFSFLCTQRWNSASKLPKIPSSLPILFCSGRNDQVVPPEHMDKLFMIALERGKPTPASTNSNFSSGIGISGCGGFCTKMELEEEDLEVPEENWTPPDDDRFDQHLRGGHVDTHTQPRYWSYIQDFLDNSLSRSRGQSRIGGGGLGR